MNYPNQQFCYIFHELSFGTKIMKVYKIEFRIDHIGFYEHCVPLKSLASVKSEND